MNVMIIPTEDINEGHEGQKQPLVTIDKTEIGYKELLINERCCLCIRCIDIRIGVICISLFWCFMGVVSLIANPDYFSLNSTYIVMDIVYIFIGIMGIYGAMTYNTCWCRITQTLCILMVIGVAFILFILIDMGGLSSDDITTMTVIFIIVIVIFSYFAWVIHSFCSLVCYPCVYS